jgi:hypothetical protein
VPTIAAADGPHSPDAWSIGEIFCRDVETDRADRHCIATDELEDKKLEIIGWKGPKIAMKSIKDSAKTFSKDGEE